MGNYKAPRIWADLSPDEEQDILRQARALRRQSPPMPWGTIARKLEIALKGLRYRLDDEYAARQLELKSKPSRTSGIDHFVRSNSAALEADVRARFAEIPEDTRDITGVLMGDPLVGRRAIDRMGAR